jgi:catechol 2,3-dioxygenase
MMPAPASLLNYSRGKRYARPMAILDPRTHIGTVSLTISDLARSADFYAERIGLTLLERGGGEALFGSGTVPLLHLVEDREARPRRGTTGLYHFALLEPSRPALSRSLRRLAETGTRLTGASDHGVSEALYLDDPDGIGIEIYRDRPREEWPRRGGELAMVTEPLDLDGLLADFEKETPPGGILMGHVHLHVSRLEEARRFYIDLLGFEPTQRYGSQALFVSAGGYHHHLGLNTWQGVGAPPPPPRSTGLRHFEIVLAGEGEEKALRGRLAAAGIAAEGGILRDPSGNGILPVIRS